MGTNPRCAGELPEEWAPVMTEKKTMKTQTIPAAGRIEADEMYVVTTDRRHHSHSVSSQPLAARSGRRSASSPAAAIFSKAASQLRRG